MKLEDYNDFYEKVIAKCLTALEERAQKFSKEKHCLIRQDNAQKKIYKYYQRKRDYIRCNYMTKKSLVSLDRHKVASCIIYAILKVRPFKVNLMVRNLPEEILMANEYLAFFVALNIIEMYRIEESKSKNHNINIEIVIPKTYHEEDDSKNTYESDFCRGLYHLSIDNVDKYDVLAYANILFLLEKYTDTYAQLPKENDR